MNGLIYELFETFNDYDGFQKDQQKIRNNHRTSLEVGLKAEFNYDHEEAMRECLSYLFLNEGVKRRTKVLKRLRLI